MAVVTADKAMEKMAMVTVDKGMEGWPWSLLTRDGEDGQEKESQVPKG